MNIVGCTDEDAKLMISRETSFRKLEVEKKLQGDSWGRWAVRNPKLEF